MNGRNEVTSDAELGDGSGTGDVLFEGRCFWDRKTKGSTHPEVYISCIWDVQSGSPFTVAGAFLQKSTS